VRGGQHAAITTDLEPTTREPKEHGCGLRDKCGNDGGVCYRVAVTITDTPVWVLFIPTAERLPDARTPAI
jgi:hypothetical protein